MSKKKKRRPSALPGADGAALSKKKAKGSALKLLYLIGATLAAFVLFETVLTLEAENGLTFSIITPIYYGAAVLLLGAVLILNRGFSKEDWTPEMFEENEAEPERVQKLCEKVNAQKKIAKKLMLFLIPLLFAIFFDMIALFYGDVLERFLSLFA